RRQQREHCRRHGPDRPAADKPELKYVENGLNSSILRGAAALAARPAFLGDNFQYHLRAALNQIGYAEQTVREIIVSVFRKFVGTVFA
ncbi:MAG: hypothetical protein IJK93_06300, partial [Muribaculaceae bacterium]|nr:hypothetical protein [Muribaculaceae bacterium]